MNSVSAVRTRCGWAGAILYNGRLLNFALVWAAVVCGVATAADLPLARLDSIIPAAAQIGVDTEVQVAGADLEGVDAAWFSHPGLSAKLVKEKVFGIKADPSVPEGVYDMRLFGSNGVSNPRAIYVGRGPTVSKAGECSLQKPMEFPLDAAVQGASVAGGRDHYRFQARKGQRLTIRCQARELDSRMTPVFSVLDASGRKLRGNERRPFLDFEAPQDGAYLVSVQDLAFGGGPEHYYRLTVDESPVLEAVVPSAVEFGKPNRVLLLGRGLKGGRPSTSRAADGRLLEELEVQVEVPPSFGTSGRDGPVAASASGLRTLSYRYRTESGVSNSVELAVLAGPVVSVKPAGGAASAASPVGKVSFPGAVSGMFEKGLQGVPVEFEAKKGDVLVAEVFSQRLGFGATNSYLRLAKDGAHLAEAYGPDLNAGGPRLSTLHNDATLRFEVKEDGKHTLFLSDLSGVARPGLGASYVLVLRRATPGFSLVAATEPPIEKADDRLLQPRGAVLRAGGTAAMRVVALRTDGFDKEILLGVEGHPAGVSCEPTRILAGKNEGVVIFRTEAGAPRNLAQVRITGRSEDGKIETAARGATARWVVPDYNNGVGEMRLTRGEGVVVATSATAAPLVLKPEADAPLEAEAGTKLEVPLRIGRSADFKEVLKIKSAGFAGAEGVKEVEVDAKAEQVKVMLDLGALKLAPGNHTAYFTAQSKAKVSGRDVITTAYSPPVQIQVRAPVPKAPTTPAATAVPAPK
jgi:hypothetical protein